MIGHCCGCKRLCPVAKGRAGSWRCALRDEERSPFAPACAKKATEPVRVARRKMAAELL